MYFLALCAVFPRNFGGFRGFWVKTILFFSFFVFLEFVQNWTKLVKAKTLNKYLGKKIKFDQKTAIVLLAFPKEVVRTTSELLNKSYELSKSAGLEPIDEDQLQRSLSWLQSHRLIYPLNDKHQEWRLVDKFRHEIDNWG